MAVLLVSVLLHVGVLFGSPLHSIAVSVLVSPSYMPGVVSHFNFFCVFIITHEAEGSFNALTCHSCFSSHLLTVSLL